MSTQSPRHTLPARRSHGARPGAGFASCLLIGALVGTAPGAHAQPPPMGSSDWAIMRDFAEWVQHQRGRSGQWCCDLADGRPLADDEIRTAGDHYQILYSRTHWADAPDPAEWLDVPPGALLGQLSPVGYVIAWVHHRYVFCVALAGAS